MTTLQSFAVASENEPAPGPPSAERRVVVWLFVAAAATFLLFQEGAITGYDGGTMYEVTRSVVEQGDFAISDEWNTLPGRNGHEYGRYGLGLSLVAAIPYSVARPLAYLSDNPERVLEAAASSAMPIVTGLLIVAVYLLARRMGARVGAALLVGIGAIAGTFLLPYGKEFFAEPLAALFSVIAIERLLANKPATSGLALGAATLTRPQNALFVPVLVVVAWRRRGVSEAMRTIAGVARGVLMTLVYNFLRFGEPLRFGYEDVGLTTPLLEGTAGLLFNPLKSLFIFAPIVVVLPLALRRLWQKDRSAFVLIGANLAITFALTATWFAWHGGWSWGPRLLVPGLLPAIAAIGPWLSTGVRRRRAVFLFAVGFVVSFPALIVSTQTQQLEQPRVPPETHFLDTQPLASPSVTRQWELIAPTARYSIEHRYEGLGDGRNYLRYLSLWQFGAMREFGFAGLFIAVAGTAVLLGVVVFSFTKLRAAAQDVRAVDERGTEAGVLGLEDARVGTA